MSDLTVQPDDYFDRGFLNDADRNEHGTFHAHVRYDDYTIAAGFTIADCYRSADLDFDMWSVNDIENVLRKAALLREAVTRFEEQLQVAAEWRRMQK